MVKWNSRNPPYRVRIPDYLQVPAEYGRVGLVVGEHRGVDGLGPLVAVLLDGAASNTVAAIKADCTVLEGKQHSKENQVLCERSPTVTGSNAARTAISPLLERYLEWHGLTRS
jgi:hypothetical protein